ncbi:MAG: YbaK/EbsC family protein [Rhodospirillaceae bacterium]
MATVADIHAFLAGTGLAHEVVPCDPDDAETAVFAEKYGYSLDDSANCILVKTKTGEEKFVACVVLATTRLDVNNRVRKKIGARKVSFAAPEDTRRLTGMDLGGVTPLCLPDGLPVWIDARVMAREAIILGGGDRASKIIVSPRVFDQVPNVEVVEDLALPLD